MAPTLQEILAQGNNVEGWNIHNILNLNSILLAIAVLALSLVTYTLVRKNGFLKKVIPTPESSEELERALVLNGKLSQEVEELKRENRGFASRLKHLEDLEKIESALRKSNLSLAKECERRKAENEELTLKLNALGIKSKPKKNIKSKRKKKR